MRYYIQFVFTLLLARILTSQAAAIAFQTFTSTNVSEPYYQATFAPYNNPPDVITCTRNGNIGKRCYQSIYFETPVTAQSATYSRCYGYDGGPACMYIINQTPFVYLSYSAFLIIISFSPSARLA